MYAAAEMRGERKVQRRGRKMVPFWRRILNLCEKGEDKTVETLSEMFGPPEGCPNLPPATLNRQNYIRMMVAKC